MKKFFGNITVLTFTLLTLIGATYALFEETVQVSSASFKIVSTTDGEINGGNTDLKILLNTGLASEGANLDDEVPGPIFDSVSKNWTADYPIKLFNNGDKTLEIISKADYVSDVDVLRDDLYIEILTWNDANNNGLVDSGEVGDSFERDTILRWRNDTFILDQIAPNETKGYILRFDGEGLTDINIGMQALYNFEFTGTEVL